MKAWLEAAVNSPTPLGISDAVLTGTARVLTHPRVFAPPTLLESALERLSALRDQRGVVRLVPGPRHWDLVRDLCMRAGLSGNDIADAAHAAVAVENGAVWVSKDRGFARFGGLRWRHPLEDMGEFDAQ